MLYILHCLEGDKLKRKVESNEMGDAIAAAEECKTATNFNLYSHEWPDHHLSGEVKQNGHIDWVRSKF